MHTQFRLRVSSNSPNSEVRNLVGKETDGWTIDYSGDKPATPLLDTVNYPIHMKNLSLQVKQMSNNFPTIWQSLQFVVLVCFSLFIEMCFSFQDLEQLAAELRAEIVFSVSKTGGHLSASLGVVELTVALHHIFNTPEDKIIWDVGHQVHNKVVNNNNKKVVCFQD